MKKIRLDVDALEVETFAADDEGSERGTVHGHSGFPDCGSNWEECDTRYGNWTCAGLASCDPNLDCDATYVEFTCQVHRC